MCDKNTTEFSGYAADLWAAGVCLFIFTTGRLPFFSMTPLKLFELIANADVPYHLHEDMSDSLQGILKKLLTKDPSERAGVGFCLQHEFCSGARIQRVNELGKEFDSSDGGIVLTKEEVKTVSDTCFIAICFVSNFLNEILFFS
jgi:serine/threonine protein kinase